MRKLIIAISVLSLSDANFVSAQSSVKAPVPMALVYKTKAGYRNLVAIQLSPDGKNVESFPDPADVKSSLNGPAPLKLHKGYLLDRRGIGWHTAFIKMTYEQYAKLSIPPTPDQLLTMVVDANPLTELYSCGPRGNAKTKSLNKTIDAGKIRKKCTPVAR